MKPVLIRQYTFSLAASISLVTAPPRSNGQTPAPKEVVRLDCALLELPIKEADRIAAVIDRWDENPAKAHQIIDQSVFSARSNPILHMTLKVENHQQEKNHKELGEVTPKAPPGTYTEPIPQYDSLAAQCDLVEALPGVCSTSLKFERYRVKGSEVSAFDVNTIINQGNGIPVIMTRLDSGKTSRITVLRGSWGENPSPVKRPPGLSNFSTKASYYWLALNAKDPVIPEAELETRANLEGQLIVSLYSAGAYRGGRGLNDLSWAFARDGNRGGTIRLSGLEFSHLLNQNQISTAIVPAIRPTAAPGSLLKTSFQSEITVTGDTAAAWCLPETGEPPKGGKVCVVVEHTAPSRDAGRRAPSEADSPKEKSGPEIKNRSSATE